MISVIRPMMTLADLAELRETEDVEIKLALGRDGQGELPKEVWPTYSAFANVETTVSHARAMTLCDMHPVDMTKLLQGLVQKGYLAKIGQGRGSKYHLHGAPLASPTDTFDPAFRPLPSDLAGQPSDLVGQPSDLAGQPSDLVGQPSDLDGRAPNISSPGGRVLGLDLPLIQAIEGLDNLSLSRLSGIAEKVSGGRVPKDVMVGVISELCTGRYVTLRVMAQLLGRSEDYLRQGYLNPLVRSGDLMLAFPQAPNDPRQAYTAFRPMAGR